MKVVIVVMIYRLSALKAAKIDVYWNVLYTTECWVKTNLILSECSRNVGLRGMYSRKFSTLQSLYLLVLQFGRRHGLVPHSVTSRKKVQLAGQTGGQKGTLAIGTGRCQI